MSNNDNLQKDTPEALFETGPGPGQAFDEEEQQDVPIVAAEVVKSTVSAMPILPTPPAEADDTHEESSEEEGNVHLSESAPPVEENRSSTWSNRIWSSLTKAEGTKPSRKRILMLGAAVLAVVIIIAVVVPVVVTRKDGSDAAQDSSVEDSTLEGSSLSELQKAWWYWSLCPEIWTFNLRECADQDMVPDGWYFLAGSGSDDIGQIVERRCEGIPNNKPILIPIVNMITSADVDWQAVEIQFLHSWENGNNYGLVDGEERSFYHVVSDIGPNEAPDCEVFESTEDFGFYADGFWMVVPALSSGEHVIEIHGEVPMTGFSTEVIHYLKVE